MSLACSQHREGTLQHEQAVTNKEASLNEVLQSHPDVVTKYFPNKDAVEEYNQYRESFPRTEDFVISILVNPCGANGTHGREDDIALGHDCCTERIGIGEYEYRPGTRNRFSNGYSNGIPADIDSALHNVDLVDEFGNELDYSNSRRAEDILYIDESCAGLRDPHMACIADRFAATRSKLTPPCWDHNSTVDASLDCFTAAGKRMNNCLQVSYSQNAFVSVCGGDDDHCGTYLEIHKENGSPYDDEETILAETKITAPITNGMQTIQLTYKNDSSKILYSYEEHDIQVGSMVRVNEKAPSCCCPAMLSPIRNSKIGAYFCPKRQWSKNGGPFASALTSLDEQYVDDRYQETFPWCPDLERPEKDALFCTQERMFADDIPVSNANRYYMRQCMPIVEVDDNASYSSADLSGIYTEACPYGETFQGCALSSSTQDEHCQTKDHHFSFEDDIGKVTQVPEDPEEKYGVSFNDGRSTYWFARSELDFLKPHGNYQIWFVQRNRYEKIVQKKKPFRVIWPRCTFDAINGRYFPYAQLAAEDGKPLAAI